MGVPDLEPMTAVAGELPYDDSWAYEIKWDGMRTLVSIDGGALSARSRRRHHIEPGLPELDALPEAIGPIDVLLDGELVAFEAGRPSFARLAERMHVLDRSTAARVAERTPVVFVAFDLLHLAGTDTWHLPYLERRRLLAEVLEPGPSWQVPAHHLAGGAELLEAARAQGLEGIMAKRQDRPYEPGRRSTAWRKVKVRPTQEFVVGGWTTGAGNRAGRMASLLLGGHTPDGRLAYVGNVGTGFTDADLDAWTTRLGELDDERCPFDPAPPRGPTTRGARWVRPEIVVQVAFAEWTPDHRLRQPSFLGEREDVDATSVPLDEPRSP